MNQNEWNPEEIRSYFMALSLIAVSDQVIADEEAKFLEQVGEAMNIEPSEAQRIIEMTKKDAPSCLKQLKSVRSDQIKRIIFRDCLIMAYADKIFQPEERFMLESVRMNLGISEELADRFTQWAKEGQAWQEKGEQLIQKGVTS